MVACTVFPNELKPLNADEENLRRIYQTYSVSEQRAVLVHKYFLGIDLRRETTLTDAVRSWETRFASGWRKEKVTRDLEAQLREIERHKYFLSQKAGREVGWEEAAADWIKHHAGAWRQWWETQSGSCP